MVILGWVSELQIFQNTIIFYLRRVCFLQCLSGRDEAGFGWAQPVGVLPTALHEEVRENTARLALAAAAIVMDL